MPVENIAEKESSNLANLSKNMNATVFGQEKAISTVVDKILVAQAGLKRDNKPIGSFVFMGPTGCGKTHLSKILEKKMTTKEKMDMSNTLVRLLHKKIMGELFKVIFAYKSKQNNFLGFN